MYNKLAMTKNKLTIKQTDQRVPELAKAATRAAYRRVRALGGEVVVSRRGRISRINADGEVFFVKDIEPQTRMKKGTIIRIK